MSLANPNFKITQTIVSHANEERLVSEFFNLECKHSGTFVDIGGNLPATAVSRPLMEAGWTGIIVEPIPVNAEALRTAGWQNVEQCAITSPEKMVTKTATLFLGGGANGPHSSLDLNAMDPRSRNNQEITVKLKTLSNLLDSYQLKHLNLLSIDTEGTELDVLKGVDFTKITIDLILVEDWQRDTKIHQYLLSQRYKIILRSGFNSWYVPIDTNLKVPVLGRIKLLKKLYLSSHIKQFKHRRRLSKLTNQSIS